jgi:hypothetical protein
MENKKLVHKINHDYKETKSYCPWNKTATIVGKQISAVNQIKTAWGNKNLVRKTNHNNKRGTKI